MVTASTQTWTEGGVPQAAEAGPSLCCVKALGAVYKIALEGKKRKKPPDDQRHRKSGFPVGMYTGPCFEYHTEETKRQRRSWAVPSSSGNRNDVPLRFACGEQSVYTYENVEELLLDIGRDNMKWPEGTSKSIGFCVSDNCAYQSNIVFQHAEKDGAFIETVNYLYFPIRAFPNGKVPELPASGP